MVPSAEPPAPPEMVELIGAMLSEGPIDPALVARMLDPAVLAKREAEGRALREQDWANLGRYEQANAALAAAGSRPDIVFMGDSITEFWTLADEALFGAGRVCRGISGQTSPQMLVRFQADVLTHRPRAVHLLTGTNDIAGNTGPTTPYRYQCAVKAMVQLAQAQGVKVLLGLIPPATPMPWNRDLLRRPWIIELNRWLRNFGELHGCTVIDYFSVLVDDTGGLPAVYSHDGLHPNRQGYARMRTALEPVLQGLGLGK